MQLDEVLATQKLSERRWRAPDHAAENRALLSLGKHFTASSQQLFERLVKLTLELCEAGSAGLSLIHKDENGGELFRWVATAGEYSKFVGGTTPRERSPCGVCLARKAPQLYDRPERYFTEFAGVEPRIVEGLVVPIFVKNRPVGTIWIVSHTSERRFDREDVRVMESVVGFIASAIQRAESDHRLKEAERFNRTILMTSPDCIKVIDGNGRIVFINQNGLKMVGAKDPSVALNQTWANFWPMRYQAIVKAAMAQATAGRAARFEGKCPTLKGPIKWWDVTLNLLPGEGNRLLVVSRDITPQKRAEAEVQKAQLNLQRHADTLEERVEERTKELRALNEQLQRLSRKLLESEEAERSHIAKELHDELGQRLTGLKLLLEGISRSDESAAKLKRAQEEVIALMKQVRDLSFDLRQGLPEHINLKTALDRHFQKLKEDETLTVQFKCNGSLESFPRETNITLYRLIQEALTNVIRHSGTSRAVVALGQRNDRIRLSISDRGMGFASDETGEGIGLRGMRERVLLCGGELKVQSKPAAGTRIDVEIPLKLP